MVFFLPAPPLAVGWHDVSVSTFHPLQLVQSWNCSLLLLQLRAIDLKCSKRLVGKPGQCEVISPAINLVLVKSVASLDWLKPQAAAERVMT